MKGRVMLSSSAVSPNGLLLPYQDFNAWKHSFNYVLDLSTPPSYIFVKFGARPIKVHRVQTVAMLEAAIAFQSESTVNIPSIDLS